MNRHQAARKRASLSCASPCHFVPWIGYARGRCSHEHRYGQARQLPTTVPIHPLGGAPRRRFPQVLPRARMPNGRTSTAHRAPPSVLRRSRSAFISRRFFRTGECPSVANHSASARIEALTSFATAKPRGAKPFTRAQKSPGAGRGFGNGMSARRSPLVSRPGRLSCSAPGWAHARPAGPSSRPRHP